MRAASMGGQVPPDHCLAAIVAFGMIVRQASETDMQNVAAGFTRDMTDDELTRAHDAGMALGQHAGAELARRRRD